jgi:hypothetical protein
LLLHGADDETTPYVHAVTVRVAVRTEGIVAEVYTAESIVHQLPVLPEWRDRGNGSMLEFTTRILGARNGTPSS